MQQWQEILLGHSVFGSSEYGMAQLPLVLHVWLAIKDFTDMYKYNHNCNDNVCFVYCAVERPPVQDFGTISQESEIIQSTSAGRSRPGGATPRPKRRSSGGGGSSGSRNRSASKKQRIEETSAPAQPVII